MICHEHVWEKPSSQAGGITILHNGPHTSWQLTQSTKKHNSKRPGHIAKVQPVGSFLQGEGHTSSLKPRLCCVLLEGLWKSRGLSTMDTLGHGCGSGTQQEKHWYGTVCLAAEEKVYKYKERKDMHGGVFILQLSFCCIFRLDLLLFFHFSQFWSVPSLHFLLPS